MESQYILAPFRADVVVLTVEGRANRIHVGPKDTRRGLHGKEYAGPRRRVLVVVTRIVVIGRRDAERLDAFKSVRPADPLKVQVRKIRLGTGRLGDDTGVVIAHRKAQASKTALDRIAERQRNTLRVLDVVQNVLATQ